jgi:nucleoside-diphosphate-sugar epimerase
MANYLITGGSGFIGSHIVETLIENGKQVRVLDDLSTGRRENIVPFLDHVEFIEGDLRDVETVRRAVEGIDFVLHQAAIPSVTYSVRDPIPTETANVVGTLMLRGGGPTIYGDGTQSRDFTYVSNVVAANLLATTAPDMVGHVFNAAAGIRYMLLELVAALNEMLGTRIEPLFAPSQPGDVKHSQSDISLIEANGYQVKMDFWAGLQRTVEWYSANGA